MDTGHILRKLRVPAGWVFFIMVVFFGSIRTLWPLTLVIAGEAIRTAASGIIKKNEELACGGIYRFVRHPLYFGSFLIAAGFCAAFGTLPIWIYFLIFFPATYISTIRQEERFLAEKFPLEYNFYRRHVPAFFPLFFRRFTGCTVPVSFSIVRCFQNGELINWLVIAATAGALFIKTFLTSTRSI